MNKSILLFVCLFFIVTFQTKTFSQNKPIFQKFRISEIVSKANDKIESKDIEGALKILDKAIANQRDLFEVYHRRAQIRRFYTKDIDGAISDLHKALEIRQDEEYIFFSLALLKRNFKNDVQGALQIYETAQKYHPNSSELYSRIAFAKSDLNDFAGAMTAMQTAVKLAPDSINLQVSLSDLLYQNKKTDEAVAGLQNFLDDYVKNANGKLPKVRGERISKDKNPRNPDGTKSEITARRYSQFDFTVMPVNNWQKWERELSEARSLAKAFIALGKLHYAQKNIDKAFSNLQTALQIDINQEDAYGFRGAIYLSNEEYGKAIVELSRAIDIADEPSYYLNRGITYLLTKDDKNSQKDFNYFLKLYPEGQEILDRRIAEARQKIK